MRSAMRGSTGANRPSPHCSSERHGLPGNIVRLASLDMQANAGLAHSGLSQLPLAEPLLGAHEVARLLAVPRSSVYEYARRRHDALPSIRIGRHVRFHRADVVRWLANQRGRRRV
jgi:excisionase family DNA binding protein